MDKLNKVLKDINTEYNLLCSLVQIEIDQVRKNEYTQRLSKLLIDAKAIKSAMRIMGEYSNKGTIPAAGDRRLAKEDRRKNPSKRNSPDRRIQTKKLHQSFKEGE